jgi:hypothetical protein
MDTVSLPARARQALYGDYIALGSNSLRSKHAERTEAERTLRRIDSEIEDLTQQRKQLNEHAVASGEDFDAVEREQHLIRAMDRGEYDPMRSTW